MNDGDTILELQDEDAQIRLLAAQRELYSEAKTLGSVQATVCLAVPVAITSAQAAGFVSIPALGILLIEIVLFALGVAFSKSNADKNRLAAGIQQRFDGIVYGIDFPNTCTDTAPVKEKSDKHLGRYGDEMLKGWYGRRIAGKKAGDAIPLCQSENAVWSERDLRRTRVLVVAADCSLCVLLAAVVITTGTESWSLALLGTILEWLYSSAISLKRSISVANHLASSSTDFELKGKDNIKRMQDLIYEGRVSNVRVPNWIYRLSRSSEESRYAG